MSAGLVFHTLLDAKCSGCGQKKKCLHIGSTVNNKQRLVLCHQCKTWLQGKLKGKFT